MPTLTRLLLAGAAAMGAMPALGQVELVVVRKLAVADQVSDSGPGASTWYVDAFVDTRFFDDMFSVEMRDLLGTFQHELSPSGSLWYYVSPGYASKTALNAAFPLGSTYLFDLFGPAAITTVPLVDNPELIPDRAPSIGEGGYDGLQGMNPNVGFVLNLSGFTPRPQANEQAMYAEIIDERFGSVQFTFSVPPTQTSFILPARLLEADVPYRMVMFHYCRIRGTQNTLFGPIPTIKAYERMTTLRFRTKRCISDVNGDGSIDLSDFFRFFGCFDLTQPCADVTGEGVVDLIDFFEFLDAYDKQC